MKGGIVPMAELYMMSRHTSGQSPESESWAHRLLDAFELKREGVATVAMLKSGNFEDLMALAADPDLDLAQYLADMRALVEHNSISPVLRMDYSDSSTGVHHFLSDEFYCVIQRIAGGPVKDNYRISISGWCALRFFIETPFVESVGNEAQTLTDAEGSFLNYGSGLQHSFDWVSPASCTLIHLLFKPESVLQGLYTDCQLLLNEFKAAGEASEPSARLFAFQVTAEMRELTRKILALELHDPLYLMLFQSRVQELLALSFKALAEVTDKGGNGLKLKDADIEQLLAVRTLLETDCSTQLTLNDIARGAGLNRRKLTEGFKILFGSGVHEYLLQQRMTQAGSLLRQGLAVSAVSEKVGYLGHGTFSRAFKRFYGVSPKQFK